MERITKVVKEITKDKDERDYGESRKWTGWEIEAVITHSPMNMMAVRHLTNRTWIEKRKNGKIEMTRSADFKADSILSLLARKMNIKMGFDTADDTTDAIFEMCYSENKVHPDYYKWLIKRANNKIFKIDGDKNGN